MNQAETAAALHTERENLTRYLESLPEAAWDKQTLCEGWRVRDVVSHLVGNAADIVAFRIEGAGSEEFNQRQVDERADRTPAQLLEEWAEQGAQFEKQVGEQPDEFWTTEFPPFGTVGQALGRIVEDLWIHAHDIRIALGDEIVPGPGREETLEVIARELPERASRLAPEVGSVTIEAGDFSRRVDVGEGSDVHISGDPATLALVGSGRISIGDAIADGKVDVQPGPLPGLGDALNIYGP